MKFPKIIPRFVLFFTLVFYIFGLLLSLNLFSPPKVKAVSANMVGYQFYSFDGHDDKQLVVKMIASSPGGSCDVLSEDEHDDCINYFYDDGATTALADDSRGRAIVWSRQYAGDKTSHYLVFDACKPNRAVGYDSYYYDSGVPHSPYNFSSTDLKYFPTYFNPTTNRLINAVSNPQSKSILTALQRGGAFNNGSTDVSKISECAGSDPSVMPMVYRHLSFGVDVDEGTYSARTTKGVKFFIEIKDVNGRILTNYFVDVDALLAKDPKGQLKFDQLFSPYIAEGRKFRVDAVVQPNTTGFGFAAALWANQEPLPQNKMPIIACQGNKLQDPYTSPPSLLDWDCSLKIDDNTINQILKAFQDKKIDMSTLTASQASGGDALSIAPVATDQAPPGLSCDSAGGLTSWLFCPVIEAISTAAQKLDAFINDELKIDVARYFGDTSGPNSGLYQLWSTFRALALSMLVIVALIMVISQAMDFGPFDAYSVKKIMPRIVAAVILISLSWELGKFFVQLSNDLGEGITSLIYSVPGVGGTVDISIVGGFLSTAGLGIAVGALGIIGLLSFVATAALGILVGLLVIEFRRLIVVVAVVTAPLAFIAFILPGTQKAWKFWKDSFQGALIVFPLIAGLIAMGHALAKLEGTLPGATTSLVQDITVLILYVGPYFLLPLVFKFASGIMGTLGGMVNDRGRGAFDRLKKYRQGKASENWGKTRNYSRLSDRNKLTRGINTVLGGGTNPRDLTRGRSGIRAGRQTGRVLQGAAALENDNAWKANQNDDQFLLALANEDMAKQKIEAARRRSQDTSRTAEERQAALAEVDSRSSALANAQRVTSRKSGGTRLAALNKLAQTGYQFAPGEQGYQELYSTVQSITGGDMGAAAAAMNEAQFHLKNAGRLDLAGINHGAGVDIKSGIRKMGNYQRGQGKTDTYHGGAAGWLGSSAVDAVTGKTAGTSAEVARGIEASLAAGETDVDSIAEWHGMLLRDKESANDVNKLEIQKQIDAIESVRVAGDPADVASGGVGPLAPRLQQNREELRRVQIDPSEIDKK